MEKRALAVQKQQWYQTITTAKQSGQSIKSWCAENGVPLSSFYSWQRKMRSVLLRQESVQFEELSPSSPKTAAVSPTQITLHIRDVTVELLADLPSDQISEIILATKSPTIVQRTRSTPLQSAERTGCSATRLPAQKPAQ